MEMIVCADLTENPALFLSETAHSPDNGSSTDQRIGLHTPENRPALFYP
jgi:hypothetical protein